MKKGEEYTCPHIGRCPMSSEGPAATQPEPGADTQSSLQRQVHIPDVQLSASASSTQGFKRHLEAVFQMYPHPPCMPHPHHAHCSGNKDVRKWEYNSIHTFSRGFYATSVTLNEARIISPGPKVSPPMYVKCVMISTEKIGR